MKYRTIGDLQEAIGKSLEKLAELDRAGAVPPALQALVALAPPEGTRVTVALCYGDTERRIRDDASGHKWDQDGGLVQISYELVDEDDEVDEPPRFSEEEEPMSVLVRIVDQSEKDPMLHFVAFKFLRDRLLPQTGLRWARSFEFCQSLVSEAIESGMLTTEKVANPRQPEFPVTGVRLNREHPVVAQHLSTPPKPVEMAQEQEADTEVEEERIPEEELP